MRFSTSFLHVTLLTFLSIGAVGCAYIIPVDPNPPRNNDVIGDRHRPQLNNVRGKTSALPRPSQSQEIAQVDARDLPPVAPVVAARAEKEMASNNVALPQESVAKSQPGDRRVPLENQQFQLAAAGYPEINSVPERPAMTGPDSAKERLTGVQSTLENDRAVADESKAQLSTDAAAEPSMLSELPKTDGVVPPSDPVKIVPPAPNDTVPVGRAPITPLPPAAIPPVVMPPTAKPSAAAPYQAPVFTNSVPQRVAGAPGMTPSQARMYTADYGAAPSTIAPAPNKQVAYAIRTSPEFRNQEYSAAETLPPLAAPVSAPPVPMEQAAPVVARPPTVVATQVALPPAPTMPPPAPVPPMPPATILASAAPVYPTMPLNLSRSDFDPLTITDAPVMNPAPVAVQRGDFDPLSAAAEADAARPTVTGTTRAAAAPYATSNYVMPSRYTGRY